MRGLVQPNPEQHPANRKSQLYLMPKGSKPKTRAPESTLEETRYLRELVEGNRRVRITLEDNEVVDGVIEFFDATFIRLTRPGEPNLFVYKHDIKYLVEDSE